MPVVPPVIMNPVALAELLRGPDGPVYRHMLVVAAKVKEEARARLKSGFPRDFLGPTIVSRIVTTEQGAGVQVGTDVTKTTAHMIYGNPILAFEWPKVGPGVFFFTHVHHPGSDYEHPTPNHPLGYINEILLAALEAGRAIASGGPTAAT